MQQSTHKKREAYLIKLARALYESALREQDKQHLELHRRVAVQAAQLFNEAFEKDGILHPDLGLELILFIELKADKSNEAEANREEVLRILNQIENKVKDN